MLAPRPNSDVAAAAIAASASFTTWIDAIGPNTSSQTTVSVGFTSASTVGSKNQPGPALPGRLPPVRTRAPSATARWCALGDERPEVGLRIHPVAKLQRRRVLDEPLDERRGDRLDDVDALRGG